MNEDKKVTKEENKRTLRKVLIVIAIFTTYIVVFLLGRITNIITLGIKEKNNQTPVTTETPVATTTPDVNNYKPGSQIKTEPITPEVKPTDSGIQPTSTPVVIPTGDEEIDIDGIIKLIQKSDNKEWNQLEELSIFNSQFYQRQYQGKIAPGFYGTYEFVVENHYDKPITYVLSFNEENTDNINMVYKVMNADTYILGNSTQNVYIDGVKLEAVTLPALSRTTYKLVWKWEDTDYDTQIGVAATAKYKLSIDFKATMEE